MATSGKKFIFVFLALLMFSKATVASEPQIPIFGPGLYACSSYVDEHITEDGKDVFNSWISGFVSSLSMYHSQRFNFQKEISPLYEEVEKLCRLEPEIFFSEAVSKAFVAWVNPKESKDSLPIEK